MVRDSAVPGGDNSPTQYHYWTASVTISNVGGVPAELLSGEVVSRFRTGLENWRVTMPGLVLQPGAVASFALQLPATGNDPDGLRAWEMLARHRSRDSKVIQWLRALQDRLPADWHADYLPRVGYGDFRVGYPENYRSMLTNELGWRIITQTNVGVGGMIKLLELRPAERAEHVHERDEAERTR